jgi:pimeloyl-ACP methyl ester carboxylesterase
MSAHLEAARLDPRESLFAIPAQQARKSLFLRRLGPKASAARRAVLYLHGATFSSALSVAYRFDGQSWRDALCAAGFSVWGLDFSGFGHSDHYSEMAGSQDACLPLGTAHVAAEQVARAASFILQHEGHAALSLISHSWGAMPAGRFAGEHPTLVDRWVLLAPITERAPAHASAATMSAATAANGMMPAWRLITAEEQWKRFVEDVPAGETPVLSRAHFADWSEQFLASDPESRSRTPAAVKVPNGPTAEIERAHNGRLGYDPSLVQAPIAIVRGAWDHLVTDHDAHGLFEAFVRSPIKRDIKIGRATHLLHLETARLAVWRESITFLSGDDVAPLRLQ